MATSPPDAFEPLRERGIAPDLWEGRYVAVYGREHPLHNPETMRREQARYTMTQGQRTTNTRFANSARDDARREGFGDGLLMHKFPFPGCEEILPQMRPRKAVRTGGRTRHDHAKVFAGNEANLVRHLNDPDSGHGGIDVKGFHEHEDFGKYTLTPKAKEDRPHDHATDPAFEGTKGREKLRGHLRAHHGCRRTCRRSPDCRHNVSGEHKYRRPVRDQDVANRLDVHPEALPLFFGAERVYFVLEGTPKNDSVLSKIRETGARASVFDVPSVTLWKAPELENVATGYLTGLLNDGERPLVVIVADADWHENEMVVRQALLLRWRLRDMGVNACIAAPPVSPGQAECKCKEAPRLSDDACDRCGGFLKGVDDFLAAGGELDNLQVLDRETPLPFSLALHADKDGTICGTLWGLAAILRCGRSAERVRDVLQNHIAAGLIESDRELLLETDEWTGALTWKGKREDWPTFTIREDARYKQGFVRLGDYRSESGQALGDVLRSEVTSVARADKALVPSPKQFSVAIKGTAERLGLTPGTVSDHATTRGWRDVLGFGRRAFAHAAKGTYSTKETADILRVSTDTVRRILQEPIEESTSMTTATTDEIIERINRMEARLAETLLSVQQTVNILAEKHPETDFSEWLSSN